MPWNSKKKKAAKRKNQKKQDSPSHPNPDPNSQDVGSGKEDESDETFMTPRSQPDIVDLSRIDEIDGLDGGESSNFQEEGSKNKKLEESVVANEFSNGLDVDIPSNYDKSVKETKLGKSDVVTNMSDGEILVGAQKDEVLKDMKESPIEKDIRKIEQSVHVDDAIDSCSSSNEKEVKVGSLPNEEMLVDNGDVNSNLEVTRSKMGNELDGNVSLERDLKEVKLDERLILVTEQSKEEVKSVQQDLPQVDQNLFDKTLRKSIEEISIPVKNSVSTIDEHNGRVKESAGSFPDADKTEIAQRNEVAHRPLAGRRSTIWNCCGLLEVLVGSDK